MQERWECQKRRRPLSRLFMVTFLDISNNNFKVYLIKNQKLRRYVKAGVKRVANSATKENLAYILLTIGFIALVIKVLRPNNKQEPASIKSVSSTSSVSESEGMFMNS